MAQVLGATGKQPLLSLVVQGLVKIAAHGQLAGRLQQAKAQIGHDDGGFTPAK
jgi:hypothetical protein